MGLLSLHTTRRPHGTCYTLNQGVHLVLMFVSGWRSVVVVCCPPARAAGAERMTAAGVKGSFHCTREVTSHTETKPEEERLL